MNWRMILAILFGLMTGWCTADLVEHALGVHATAEFDR